MHPACISSPDSQGYNNLYLYLRFASHLVSKMTAYVSSGTLNSTYYSLLHRTEAMFIAVHVFVETMSRQSVLETFVNMKSST